MSKIITKKEAVELHANEAQKAHFEKYGRFVSTRYEDGLLNTMGNEIYEYAKVVKNPNGRGNAYEIGEKRREQGIRKDGRKNNGATIPYEYELNSLVVDCILKKQRKGQLESMSLNRWITDEIRLIDRRLTSAYYSKHFRKSCFDELALKYNNDDEQIFTNRDISMLTHFVQNELTTLKNNLVATLNKLEKHKIIMHKVEWKGLDVTKNKHRPLTENEFHAIGQMKREVATKHDISVTDLWKDNEETEKFWEEHNKRLENEFGFKYIYEAHGAV